MMFHWLQRTTQRDPSRRVVHPAAMMGACGRYVDRTTKKNVVEMKKQMAVAIRIFFSCIVLFLVSCCFGSEDEHAISQIEITLQVKLNNFISDKKKLKLN